MWLLPCHRVSAVFKDWQHFPLSCTSGLAAEGAHALHSVTGKRNKSQDLDMNPRKEERGEGETVPGSILSSTQASDTPSPTKEGSPTSFPWEGVGKAWLA